MRIPVEPRRTYRLINHGPSTLIAAAHAGRVNVMAAAWVVAVDFEPPKLAAVVSADTFTRGLVEASGEFTVNLPTAAMADLTWTVGHVSGRDVDKVAAYGIRTSPATRVGAPLIEGCVGWLECRVLPYPDVQRDCDLFLAEVVAAWADPEVFVNGEWRFGERPDKRTIHHMARGVFYATGERIEGKELPRLPTR